ncbi:hypothetical protein [Streptomyces sp. NRRL WC-3719]|uniref:hypothetical protein n=1 Tax=Streptomyces sp. NRRL WC-3719 TaxID=1463932 RepID=UPI0004CD8BD4|nr:hypothetical protein [Streptomyces sp. NRRL WC-3719]
MSELPPDLPRLEVLRTWLQLTLAQVDARITQLRAEQAARQRAVPAGVLLARARREGLRRVEGTFFASPS